MARVPASSGPQILTVSALARSVRDLLEHRYPLLWVAGEISNFTVAKSGHAYFVLKDDQAQARCVMFRSRQQLLEWEPREGMQVEAQVLVSLYEARGEFQLNVETMRRAGLGARFEAFVKLRDKLEREGLFDAAAKRSLPAFPRTVGVITSRDAAALRDVLTTLRRRNPSIAVVLYPVSVQGNRAGEEIVSALGRAGRRGECDVLLLVRGGGSIEDLWTFNEESVARAVRACPIPSRRSQEKSTRRLDARSSGACCTSTSSRAGWFIPEQGFARRRTFSRSCVSGSETPPRASSWTGRPSTCSRGCVWRHTDRSSVQRPGAPPRAPASPTSIPAGCSSADTASCRSPTAGWSATAPRSPSASRSCFASPREARRLASRRPMRPPSPRPLEGHSMACHPARFGQRITRGAGSRLRS